MPSYCGCNGGAVDYSLVPLPHLQRTPSRVGRAAIARSARLVSKSTKSHVSGRRMAATPFQRHRIRIIFPRRIGWKRCSYHESLVTSPSSTSLERTVLRSRIKGNVINIQKDLDEFEDFVEQMPRRVEDSPPRQHSSTTSVNLTLQPKV
jgi:hypothetical protein